MLPSAVFCLASGTSSVDPQRWKQVTQAPRVPTTSIYSRTDGVVAWRTSVEAGQRANTENIEVIASHLGIGMNPSAMWAVADRLAQPEGAWQPFERKGLLRGLLYPDPAR